MKKRRGVAIREAFNQIKRYQRDSFWAASGLYEYVQIFVISNGTNTKYYSNTTRSSHIKEQNESGRKKSKKTSNSFEFTSCWADGNNQIISDLRDFTKTFLAKHTILNILTRYCVFTSEDVLLVMRPYQIAATERILNRIEVSSNYKQYGSLEAGGYIWHTTGSGKTLTSFKTAQLAARLSDIDKVLFVVDRKDLDYQAMKEYDRFEKGAANSNTSTRVLQKQLEDSASRIIITTIQKLGLFIKKNKGHEAFKKHIVLIFDECHRSQFGEMHTLVVKHFKKYHMFGFTGTPIFAVNAAARGDPHMKTTPQAFGDKLHTYTIVNAINDGNVLPFRIDYVNTIKAKAGIEDAQISAVDRERAMAAPDRISSVVQYILQHFEQKTKRNEFYSLKGQRTAGFNSIFAVSSIPVAMKYYAEFQKQLAENGKRLTIATIFSFSPNEADPEDITADENFDTESLDKPSRDFLEDAISDYNKRFSTNYDTSADKFQNYYKDLSMRVKNREVDLLIVVNMFLTGFDATTLNTLWVDKLKGDYPLGQPITGEENQRDFVRLFGTVLKLRNVLTSFDEFRGNEIMAASELQDYQSLYIDLYNEFKSDSKADKENINDDLVFALELIRQVEINIDYILMLVSKYHESNCEDKTVLVSISKAISSSMQLRSKKELIEAFISMVNADTQVDEDWKAFVTQQKDEELDALITKEKLKPEAARTYVNNSLRDGTLKTTGTDFNRLMLPVSRFGGGREAKKERIIEKVMKFFEKYQRIIGQ